MISLHDTNNFGHNKISAIVHNKYKLKDAKRILNKYEYDHLLTMNIGQLKPNHFGHK